jgi:hypothetical protein
MQLTLTLKPVHLAVAALIAAATVAVCFFAFGGGTTSANAAPANAPTYPTLESNPKILGVTGWVDLADYNYVKVVKLRFENSTANCVLFNHSSSKYDTGASFTCPPALNRG